MALYCSLILLLISLSFLCKAQNNYEGCTFNISDSHGIYATYDLTWFRLPENKVFEVDDNVDTDRTYKFNICSKISATLFNDGTTIPSSCLKNGTAFGPCTHIKEDGTCNQQAQTLGKTASAVQINYDVETGLDTCFWLGMQVPNEYEMDEFEIALIDPEDAGKGVVYTITNGQWCPAARKNRELKVRFICPDERTPEFIPADELVVKEEVDEVSLCVYELNYESPMACPGKCLMVTGVDAWSVCATRGICANDFVLNYTRCLCDDGYSGDFCEIETNETRVMHEDHSGLLAAIIICIIMLGCAIVLAAVLCHQIRMKESEAAGQMSAMGGAGLIKAEQEDNAQKVRDAATSLEIGNVNEDGNDEETMAHSLQTIDDHIKKDEGNELLDDVDDADDNNNSNPNTVE